MSEEKPDFLFGQLRELEHGTPVDDGQIPEGHQLFDKDEPENNSLPSPTNCERAEWAYNGLKTFAFETFSEDAETMEDAETVISDFLCDLRHLCRMNNLDYDEIDDRARRGAEAEEFDGGWS